jgi:hypothetical protein
VFIIENIWKGTANIGLTLIIRKELEKQKQTVAVSDYCETARQLAK